jgi:hypothetical protein
MYKNIINVGSALRSVYTSDLNSLILWSGAVSGFG